ncbi:lactate utilization protein C [Lutibacter sp.]|uniref:LutC/YkgG family protein n=1 Tax=Lutibacter sp. TaxID=1925666 RepID=UPI003566C61F
MGREAILKSVKENKPTLLPLPEIDETVFFETIDLVAFFKEKVALVGGSIIEINKLKEIDAEIKKRYPKAKDIISCSQKSTLETISISEKTNPHELESIHLAILDGDFGLAENGAIWISEKEFPIRVLPFITNDLVIILNKEKLYSNLHEAYKLIANRERTFGLFISGPSKTADIEQCLVIGAQGAMSLTVFLINK